MTPFDEMGDENDDGPGVRGTGYTTIPTWVLESDISDRAIRLFVILNRYVGTNDNAWPSRKTLAEKCGRTSVPSIDRALRELVAIGAIQIEQRRRGDGSLTSSLYWLWPKTLERADDQSRRHPLSPVTPGVASPVIHHEETTVRSNNKEDSLRTAAAGAPPDKAFSTLWSAYPRKSDKIGARKQVVARLKAGVPFEELLDATENYALRRSGQDQEKTMYGKTFWNNERWKDWLPGGAEDVIRPPSRSKVTEIVDDTMAALDEFFNSAASDRQIRRTPIVVHLLGLFTLKKLGSMPARDLRLLVEGVAQQMQYPS
jgi:hypothetical protein